MNTPEYEDEIEFNAHDEYVIGLLNGSSAS